MEYLFYLQAIASYLVTEAAADADNLDDKVRECEIVDNVIFRF